ncbi:diguanylate cyclase domain-containing protein [Pseudooctadecabacter sp.]|uniref:diguanylate cyclase domain-containing protein n=1 Tax=Pseudooctadecabacter sp. TaxID=1966338 RepID=UPI0035C790AA
MGWADAKVQAGGIKNLAYLDADAFKSVNDTYGHAVGDAYLQNIAEAIKSLFGDTSRCSRPGGDEFVIADTALGDDDFGARLDQ